MSAHFEDEIENLPHYRGGDERLTLEIGKNDGRVFVGLWPSDGSETAHRRALLEIEEAERAVRALNAVIGRLKAEGA